MSSSSAPPATAERLDKPALTCNPLHRHANDCKGTHTVDRQLPTSAPRIANAPLSYGAFEMTVGTSFPVPPSELVLAEVTAAGYEGIDLGPPGYLGDVETLAERLGGPPLGGGGGPDPLQGGRGVAGPA